MKQSGITLIEMMIVVLVLGVIAATTTPLVANAYHRQAVRTAADEFRSSHALARSVAMKYGRRAALHIGSTRFWVALTPRDSRASDRPVRLPMRPWSSTSETTPPRCRFLRPVESSDEEAVRRESSDADRAETAR
jgi:prepilin-type N-terminal cleavage/methylation domain-containing protein